MSYAWIRDFQSDNGSYLLRQQTRHFSSTILFISFRFFSISHSKQSFLLFCYFTVTTLIAVCLKLQQTKHGSIHFKDFNLFPIVIENNSFPRDPIIIHLIDTVDKYFSTFILSHTVDKHILFHLLRWTITVSTIQ